MSRLDFLPDAPTLASLLDGLNAGPQTKRPSSMPTALKPPRSIPGAARGEAAFAPDSTSSWPPEAPRSRQTGDAEGFMQQLQQVLETANSLDARFAAFVGWLQARLCARSAFITDEDGLEMVHSDAGEGYLAAAGEIGTVLRNLASMLPDVKEGSTNLVLADRSGAPACVELVWCHTALGRYTVGLVLDAPLTRNWTREIREALQQVTRLQVKAG